MKKILLWMLASVFVLGDVSPKNHHDDDEQQMTKEEKRMAKERKKQEKKQEKEMKKDEKRREHEVSAEARRAKSDAKKHEKAMRKAEKRAEEEEKKEERKQEREAKNSKESKALKKQEKRAAREHKKNHDQERMERKNEKRHNHHERKQERTHQARQQHEQKLAMMEEQDDAFFRNKYEAVELAQRERKEMMAKWRDMRKTEVEHDKAAGMYSDLYKSPSWPTAALFYENKTLLNVFAQYQYACDCYNSTGAGSKSNITQLAFGETPFTTNDILLASRLVEQGILADNAAGDAYYLVGSLANAVTGFGNKPLMFVGREEKYGVNFELSRYVVNRNLALGAELPFLYNKHTLKVNIPTNEPTFNGDGIDIGASTVFKKVLLAKGITELGGSAAGLGDVAFFMNGQIDSSMWDKLVLGLRAQFPTGKKATQNKLWAPELGNGGFTEISGFGALLLSYKQYINPHILLQGSFSLPAHVARRVPQLVSLPAGVITAADIDIDTVTPQVGAPTINVVTPTANPADPLNIALVNAMAFGNRVLRANDLGTAALNGETAVAINDFDTTVKGFADHVQTVKIQRGSEIKLRIGNMCEHFLCRRGFLEIFYDFRGKAKDRSSGLNADTFNISVLRDHTQELEHRAGFEYSYQYDLDTRVRLNSRYTFAGMNVPKTFEVTGILNRSF